jgi:hypothetical protein
MRYHTVSEISANRKKTPEGYLVCLGVPVARAGVLEYDAEELGDEFAEDEGTVLISRDVSVIFDPAAVASYEGKPVTIGHPDDDVTPDNWRDEAMGHAQNVRPGSGEEADLLLADLVVTDPVAIELIESGELREVSCGYDAEYERVAPGKGRQHAVRGNHIALVDRGRNGPRCGIKDGDMKSAMMKKVWDALSRNPRVKKALDAHPDLRKTLDEAAEETPTPATPAEAPGAPQPATDNEDRLAALEARVEELMLAVRGRAEPPAGDAEPPVNDGEGGEPDEDKAPPASDSDEPGKARDMARRTADAALLAGAKVLAPRVPFRAGDSALAVTRSALREVMGDGRLAPVIDACLGGKTLDAAGPEHLASAFTAATAVAEALNNKKTADALTRVSVKDFGAAPATPEDINKINREYYSRKGA